GEHRRLRRLSPDLYGGRHVAVARREHSRPPWSPGVLTGSGPGRLRACHACPGRGGLDGLGVSSRPRRGPIVPAAPPPRYPARPRGGGARDSRSTATEGPAGRGAGRLAVLEGEGAVDQGVVDPLGRTLLTLPRPSLHH